MPGDLLAFGGDIGGAYMRVSPLRRMKRAKASVSSANSDVAVDSVDLRKKVDNASVLNAIV